MAFPGVDHVGRQDVAVFTFILQGDSGGPLMCQRCSSCAWFLHGLTSFGSVDCGQSRKPGVYTKLGRYTDFINDVAQQIYNILPPGQRRNDELNIANGNFSSCN